MFHYSQMLAITFGKAITDVMLFSTCLSGSMQFCSLPSVNLGGVEALLILAGLWLPLLRFIKDPHSTQSIPSPCLGVSCPAPPKAFRTELFRMAQEGNGGERQEKRKSRRRTMSTFEILSFFQAVWAAVTNLYRLGWLQQQFGDQVQDQDSPRSSVWWGPASWSAEDRLAVASHGGKQRALGSSVLIRSLILSMMVPPSWPNYLPNTITLEI